MLKRAEGSTGRLLELCIGYFVFYVITGVAVKYYLGSSTSGFPGMVEMEYLVYSTAGGNLICLAVVFWKRWFKLESNRRVSVGPFSFPSECLYIVPSGICTAVVIPTTTLMYTLPISVMVAMVIMRGAVIVISRLVDEIQIRQGILKKKLYPQENYAVFFALAAVAVNLFWDNRGASFDFVRSTPAMVILSSYVVAYWVRIYIMNYFKNTRPKGAKLENNAFFAVEQITATVVLVSATIFFFYAPPTLGWSVQQIDQLNSAISAPHPAWEGATLSGVAYGIVAFFSVFIFMFKGRTATFAGLVNRLTSLMAGTASTILFAVAFGGKMPKPQDWVSLGFILVAVGFLTVAERKRAEEAIPEGAAPAHPRRAVPV